MRTYIGVKIVKARPCDLAEAQALRIKFPIGLPSDARNKSRIKDLSKEGYLVEDSMENVKWFPKEIFEREYRAIDCNGFADEQ